jgi:hypothetical protein
LWKIVGGVEISRGVWWRKSRLEVVEQKAIHIRLNLESNGLAGLMLRREVEKEDTEFFQGIEKTTMV